MPVFEKSQPRKFTPINYEPRRVHVGKDGSNSRSNQGTDIFLQKRDMGIRYMDWASAPQKDTGRTYSLYSGRGFLRTIWDTICHWFRKPTPLLKEAGDSSQSKSASPDRNDRTKGKSKNVKGRRTGSQQESGRNQGNQGQDKRSGAGRNQRSVPSKNAQSNNEEGNSGANGAGRRSRNQRRRRQDGPQQGRDEQAQPQNRSGGRPSNRSSEPRAKHQQQQQSRGPNPAESNNPVANTGNPESGGDGQARRRNRNRRRNRGRGNGNGANEQSQGRNHSDAGE